MTLETSLRARSGSTCELCGSTDDLCVYEVPPVTQPDTDRAIMTCATCEQQIQGSDSDLNASHWRCLNDSMWSQTPAVQVMAFRMLSRLSNNAEAWAQDLLDMLYLEEDTKAWAEEGLALAEATKTVPTFDSNGTELQTGDTVTLIKDLVVKGAGFTAKRGTAVRGISLTDNPEQIEGRVNGTRIVLLTCYLKKQ
ncbi:hypothetical protein VST7929_02754 [Vibrio stylophorae]|uniref:PhnA protein N-terminal proteobacterial domain-containing protein n=1 Tax=Vibrio stylophorae TaxID=659351 RepID=A0ABN8DZH8_9VIBR|nr:alkylphosphonate utilization protein [Vibrio stylophorae]CAH0535093.1 hypothetical protein VST7929_02754 [Vibrio stylophorae]